MVYTYVHHSGRFDRTPEHLVRGFENDRVNHKADIVAFTEVAAEKRGNALAAHVRSVGWGWFRAPAAGSQLDECAFAWDASKFVLVEGFGEVLSDVTTTSTSGRKRAPFAGTFIVLKELATGDLIVFATCHTPSHVQQGSHWFNNRRALQHRLGLAKMNRIVRRLMRKYKPRGGRVISMDLNLSLKLSFVQKYLRATFPGFRIVTDKQQEATHDHRPIDVILIGGRVLQKSDQDVYVTVDSDHKVIIVKLSHK